MDILEKIDKLLASKKNRHSFFQLKHFAIGKELTHQGRLRACIVELETRKEGLESLALEIAEQKDLLRLDELEMSELAKKEKEIVGKTEKEKCEINIRRLQRKIDSKNKKIDELRNKLIGYKEEATFILTIFEQLNKIEKIKDWDDPDVQLEYWNAKFWEELNTRFLIGLPVDTELIRCVSALPNSAPAKKQLVNMLEANAKKLNIAKEKQDSNLDKKKDT